MSKFNSLANIKDELVNSCNEIFSKNLSIRFFIGYEKLIGSRCGSHLEIVIFNDCDKQEAVLEIFDELCAELESFCESKIKKSNFQGLDVRLYIEESETYEELFCGEVNYNSIENVKNDVSNIRFELTSNNGDYNEEEA